MSDPRQHDSAEPTTHFGYQNVPESQKAQKVAEVFHSVAAKYDLMNDVLSGGLHRLWKRFTIELSGVRPGNRVLDIAGGTGDLTLEGTVTRVTQALAVPVQAAVPVSGGTVTIGAGTHTLALIAGAAVTGLTINLPSAPASGQRLEITTNVGITGVTIVPGAGHSIDGSVTSLAAAAPPAWVFVGGANNRWMKV